MEEALVLALAFISAVYIALPVLGFGFEGSEYPVIDVPDINRRTNMVEVGTVGELTNAILKAKPGDSIYIQPGDYRLTEISSEYEQDHKQRNNLIFRDVNDVLIRSATGNPEDVIIRGSGFHKKLAGPSQYIPAAMDIPLGVGQGAYGITFYGLTIEESNAYGIYLRGEDNVHDILIQNCVFKNINQYALKGSRSYSSEIPRTSNVYVIGNEFFLTMMPLKSDHFEEFNGNYIGAIDIMVLKDAVIADNVIRDYRGATGEALGATLLWIASENVIYERNLIYDCDQGVAFGNAAPPVYKNTANYHVKGGIIRNNVIINSTWDLIEISYSEDIKIYNNTLIRMDTIKGASDRGIRDSVSASKNVEIKNNIMFGGRLMNISGGTRGFIVENNLISQNFDIAYFMDAEKYDFRLTGKAVKAIGKALPLREVYNDFDLRKRSETPDMGAYEFSPAGLTSTGGLPVPQTVFVFAGGFVLLAAGLILALYLWRRQAG